MGSRFFLLAIWAAMTSAFVPATTSSTTCTHTFVPSNLHTKVPVRAETQESAETQMGEDRPSGPPLPFLKGLSRADLFKVGLVQRIGVCFTGFSVGTKTRTGLWPWQGPDEVRSS